MRFAARIGLRRAPRIDGRVVRGRPGIDLGTLRYDDAAIMFGLPAAAEILDGWRQAIGRPAGAVYWDLVAALTTPAAMARWLPMAHDHGRVDLDAASLDTRRDAFLRAALDQRDRD